MAYQPFIALSPSGTQIPLVYPRWGGKGGLLLKCQLVRCFRSDDFNARCLGKSGKWFTKVTLFLVPACVCTPMDRVNAHVIDL